MLSYMVWLLEEVIIHPIIWAGNACVLKLNAFVEFSINIAIKSHGAINFCNPKLIVIFTASTNAIKCEFLICVLLHLRCFLHYLLMIPFIQGFGVSNFQLIEKHFIHLRSKTKLANRVIIDQ